MTKSYDAEDWKRLGEEIQERRRWMWLDQKGLAAAAGISENTVGNYERGRVPARNKIPAGYRLVEKALHWATGSVERVLDGKYPILLVEGDGERTMQLRSPDDPAYKDDPFMQTLLAAIREAMKARELSMILADTAERWGAPEDLIQTYLEASEALMLAMIAPGRGPDILRKEYAKHKGVHPSLDAANKAYAESVTDEVNEE